jgi:hypothetical protein
VVMIWGLSLGRIVRESSDMGYSFMVFKYVSRRLNRSSQISR